MRGRIVLLGDNWEGNGPFCTSRPFRHWGLGSPIGMLLIEIVSAIELFTNRHRLSIGTRRNSTTSTMSSSFRYVAVAASVLGLPTHYSEGRIKKAVELTMWWGNSATLTTPSPTISCQHHPLSLLP